MENSYQLVSLSPALLAGIETLAQFLPFSISEIAGGSHGVNSSHYYGNSMDINILNNRHVDTDHWSLEDINTFREAAIAAGATTIYDPYHEPPGGKHYHSNHIHIQW